MRLGPSTAVYTAVHAAATPREITKQLLLNGETPRTPLTETAEGRVSTLLWSNTSRLARQCPSVQKSPVGFQVQSLGSFTAVGTATG